MKRKVLLGLLIVVLGGMGVGIYMWNKPHKHPEDAKVIIEISAVDLYKAYTDDETKANKQYLAKSLDTSLSVSGIVGETEKNQDGGTMVMLETGDPVANVQCSMRQKEIKVAKGQKVKIIGFCSGSGITGVTLTDCILK